MKHQLVAVPDPLPQACACVWCSAAAHATPHVQGAAPLIRSKDYLSAAAGLLGTEAYHAGALRAILLAYADSTYLGFKVADVAKAISNLRDAADGPVDKDKGIFDSKGKPVLAPGDRNRISFSRSPAEVLKIATLGAKNGKGGFFPQGLNGKIH